MRQANIHFLGSGQGSVTAAGILEVLPSLADEIDKGTFTIDVVTRPLSEVEETWTESPGRAMQRVVFAPVR